MARPDDDLVERLERFREEQRAIRAARRAARQQLDAADPDPAASAPGTAGTPPDPATPVDQGTAAPAVPGTPADQGTPASDLPAASADPALPADPAAADRDPIADVDPFAPVDPALFTDEDLFTSRTPVDPDQPVDPERLADELFAGLTLGEPDPPADQAEPEEPDEPEDRAGPGRFEALTPRELTIERIRTGIRGVGQTLITCGVIILLFVVYELWITDIFNEHKQGQLADKLSDTWNRGDDPLDAPTVGEPGVKVRSIPIGEGIALIRIPALGLDYVRVIVEGTGEASLTEGPGHYVDTALPGQVGNFAVAGHRVGKGSPFLDLDRLKAGDAIVIETKTSYYVYRVLGDRRTGNPTVPDRAGIPGREIVDPTDVEVIKPVPDHPGLTPTRRFLTLTTCHPRFSARQRMIIHAELDGPAWPKSKGLPPVLKG